MALETVYKSVKEIKLFTTLDDNSIKSFLKTLRLYVNDSNNDFTVISDAEWYVLDNGYWYFNENTECIEFDSDKYEHDIFIMQELKKMK